QMHNLVYYKDGSGVVSGPLKEEEATALYKANFFSPNHVFRIVDSNNSEEFTSIGVLNKLGKSCENGENELIRVYKEFATVLQERNELKKKAE
ncbi:hypothetical protein PMAYCL1PPCAC_13782, partial [Pristionchus mayeri]